MPAQDENLKESYFYQILSNKVSVCLQAQGRQRWVEEEITDIRCPCVNAARPLPPVPPSLPRSAIAGAGKVRGCSRTSIPGAGRLAPPGPSLPPTGAGVTGHARSPGQAPS